MSYSSPEFRVKCTELLREVYKDVKGKTFITVGTMEDIISLSRRLGIEEKDVDMGLKWLRMHDYLELVGAEYYKLTQLGIRAVSSNLRL